LQKLVVVRYNDKTTLPLMPEARVILLQNCHGQVLQAMWALTHGEQDIYLASLNQLQNWITTYFINDAVNTQAALMQIANLKNKDIRPASPKIEALTLIG